MDLIYQTEFGARSHPGRKRRNNEDFVAWFEPTILEDAQASGSLYLVADGVGGAAKGERASQYAVQKVLYEYFRYPEVEPGNRLRTLIRQAGNEIYDYAAEKSDEGPMATTFVAAVVRANALMVASVGDSRAYLIRNNRAYQLTEDHTDSVKKNKLTRSLGGERDVMVDVSETIALKPGDRILLCTDGLTRYASEEEICGLALAGAPEKAAEGMIDFANQAGGADNISVILVEVGQEAEIGEILRKRTEASVKDDIQRRQTQAFHDTPPSLLNSTSASPLPKPLQPYMTGLNSALQEYPRLVHVAVFSLVLFVVVCSGVAIFALIRYDLKPVNEYAVAQVTQTAQASVEIGLANIRETETQVAIVAMRIQELGVSNTAQAFAIQNSQTALAAQLTAKPVTPSPIPATALPTTSLPPQPGVCVIKMGVYLSTTLWNAFQIGYDKANKYYYYLCIQQQPDLYYCWNKQEIENHDEVSQDWWLEVPDITREKCNGGGGQWVLPQPGPPPDSGS